jgi:hypothetical protein
VLIARRNLIMNHKRFILGLSGMAAAIAVSGAALLSGATFSERSEVMYMTDGPTYAELVDLTKASNSVAHVKIVSASKAYYIPFDKASAVVSPAPSDNGPKDKARDQAPIRPADGTPPPGVLKTDFTVEVIDNVRGTSLKRGQQVVVSQLGGTVATKRPDGVTEEVIVANAEHDELMQVGAEEILFLSQDDTSGKFFTTGGGLGRFIVQSNGTLLAADHESPLARTQNGKPAASLMTAVQAVK